MFDAKIRASETSNSSWKVGVYIFGDTTILSDTRNFFPNIHDTVPGLSALKSLGVRQLPCSEISGDVALPHRVSLPRYART
jgi:hypothetical protein